MKDMKFGSDDELLSLQTGVWRYVVNNTDSGEQRVAVSVTSQAAKIGEFPIVTECSWGARDLSLSTGNPERQILYVSVSRGNYTLFYHSFAFSTNQKPP